MRKLTVTIPLKAHSERVKDKNFRLLNGMPLYCYALEKAQQLQRDGLADTVSIFGTASVSSCVPSGIEWHEEKESLVRRCSNDLFVEMADCCTTDLVMVLNATSPFLRLHTIERAIRCVQAGVYDSACSAVPLRGRLWDQRGYALNHDPTTCPRTQDQEPLYFESDGFWLAERKLFQHHRRVGHHPLFVEVSGVEAIDIDTEADWELAELAAQTWRLDA